MGEGTVAGHPFDSARPLVDEYHALSAELADPALHADPARVRRVGRRHAELGALVAALGDHERVSEDLEAARELSLEDPSFGPEVAELEDLLATVTRRVTTMLAPRDPHDALDALVEVKSGEGGEESALFARDLFTMYQRHAERRGWVVEVLDGQATDLGGWKSVTFLVRARPGSTEIDGPYAMMKFEAGVHRVQRVPVTESQGRVHTSAAGVVVMPDVDPDEVEVRDDDLRIDVFRASGPGGQGVNTTDSAVRITHLPTGTVVSCQNQRSQLQNKESALRMLRARLTALAEEQAAQTASSSRREQVRTVDRSERVRTYNFPENRLTDHRIGFKAHNLDHVLDGDLDAVAQALAAADLAARLAGAGGDW